MINKLLCKYLKIHTYNTMHITTEDLGNGYCLKTYHVQCDYCDDQKEIIVRKPTMTKGYNPDVTI